MTRFDRIACFTLLALLVTRAALADAKDDAIELARSAEINWRSWEGDTPTKDLVEPYPDGYGEHLGTLGRDCIKSIDALPADTKFETRSPGSKTMTSAEIKPVCQQLAEFGDAFEKIVDEREGAARAAIVARYEAAGAKGDRLAFLVEWDSVYFMRKGCQYVIEDAAELVAAKVLFQWLENSDGTYTVRKFTLKGNKVKSTTEKTYSRVEKAQAGCK